MSKRQFKSQASSSRAVPESPFGRLNGTSIKSTLSYRAAEFPDLLSISDPNIVVAFKNLSKADGTTKTKALDLLGEYAAQHPNEHGGVEDSILEAWVKLYPRLSINNHRRVREESHGLQVKLLQSARKRMERHLPDTVGSWLAGCYDRDGLVARAARNGIASFLDTDSKDKAFWTRCQDRIVDYALEAINETPQTLSDEHSTSSEDSASLYLRVMSSSMSLVANLLLKLRKEDISKFQEQYEEYLHNKKLWAFASSEDSFLRKTLYHLLVVCLEKQPKFLENSLDRISLGVIVKGLSASQLMSASQLLQALGDLTAKFPHVWTSAYVAGRGSSFSRLENFIQKGSQGGYGDYWLSLNRLFALLPNNVIPSKTSTSLRFLNEYRQVMQGRDQSRQYADQAWTSYFSVAGVFLNLNSDPSFQASLFREAVLPIFEKYLQGEPERVPVTLPALSKAFVLWGSNKNIQPQDSVSLCFQKLASSYIARGITASHVQLEDTEHYDPTQKRIIAEGHRWFMLLSEILRQDVHKDLVRPFAKSTYGILNSAIKTVIDQAGKSYSAAAVIEISMRLTPAIIQKSSEILSSIKSLVETHLPTPAFVFSPSARYLISLLFLLHSLQDQDEFFKSTWEGALNSVARQSCHTNSLKTIGALIADPSVCAMARETLRLQGFLLEAYSKAILGETEAWSLFETATTYDCYSRHSVVTLLEQSLGYLNPTGNNSISAADQSERAFKALEFISKHRPTLLNQGKEIQMMMTAMLLEITEISDKAIASRALALMNALKSSGNVDDEVNHNSTLDLVQWNLELEPSNSRVLLIETLVAQAKLFREQHSDEATAISFFPDNQKWIEALSATLALPPSSALGVMRPFAGAVFLASHAVMRDSKSSEHSKTFPIAVRMALYTAQFVTDVDLLLQLPTDAAVDMLSALAITTEIVNDQLDLLANGEYPPWFTDADDDEMDDLRILASNAAFAELIKHAYQWQMGASSEVEKRSTSCIVNSLISHLLVVTGSGSGAYYSTKALGHLVKGLVDTHGWEIASGETWLSSLNLFGSSSWHLFGSSTPPNALGTTAILTGLGTNISGSKLVNTFCNRLISDVAGASATAEKTTGLLVQLNAMLSVYEDDKIPVAKNRLIFAVKQILSWTPNLASTDAFLSSEACRALHVLLPAIKDVYGTYWETALEFCISIWQSNQDSTLSDSHLPITGMSLKLYSILRKLDEANDDLEEALAEHSETISRSLTNLLQLCRPKQHQPMEFVDALLLRQIRNVPPKELEDVSDLYPLLASENRNSQSAAYNLLERSLTEVQQQLSIDVLLEKKTARLPDELLSMLLEPPLIVEFLPEALDEFPSTIRGYLLSWRLVYKSYANASFKVRNDYSDLLKSENFTGPFLGLLFDLLNHFGGKSSDVNKDTFEPSTISKYDMWTAIDSETPKRDMYCLVVNLYYMCLKYTPNLARNWYLDCKSKQTKLAAGKWTVKVFSPILVQEVKDEITKWGEEQDAEKPLIIKASKNSPEIHAGYEIDDLMMQIVVSMPEDYPLQGVEVRGVNRVAANEKTWRAWQVIAQGVMRVNTIVDGLVLFRENVVAAMAGKTECAICYSIIGSDKRMPEKRCGACKNLFHGHCLFKWFQSSNQNTCPLCRNAFTYGAETLRRN
ncbi:hypothetical protein BJ875DRAFT_202556 [Amylocarpus encephaloides]|uniref:E3 ubiquitin-protein ligase listerin n=1 Tax=Amylocarpus encephaloides TaxID=45428 RepID=A0A9P8C1N0_9HELO|nr:hypothetical protein BJ875DRAFT_202556 [Amylocarpus encephaloides]